MKNVAILFALLFTAACADAPKLSAGDGIKIDSEKISVDPDKVPLAEGLSSCRDGEVITRSQSNWACQAFSETYASKDSLAQAQSALNMANDKIAQLQTQLAALQTTVASIENTMVILNPDQTQSGDIGISGSITAGRLVTKEAQLFSEIASGESTTCTQLCALNKPNGICVAAWSNSDNPMTCSDAQTYARCLCAGRP